MRTYTASKPLLDAKDVLGEAPVWDAIRSRLYWVDIDRKRVHWYEPSSGRWSFRSFPQKISAISCTASDDGLLAAFETGFAFIRFETLFECSEDVAPLDIIAQIAVTQGEKRLNEGMTDPAGRFIAGTMGKAYGTHDGRLIKLCRGVVDSEPLMQGITCTNGMGWVDEGRKMYFTDSWEKRIDVYDYDPATGTMHNKQSFSQQLPEPYGWPDGMCNDTDGGVWTARWGAGKVIRLTPSGEVDVVIDFPRAWNITSCVFGGPLLEDLYVTSASTDIEGDGPSDRPDGGSLYVVKGLGFKGTERFRYQI